MECVLVAQRERIGNDNEATFETMGRLAQLYVQARNFEQAISIYMQIIEVSKSKQYLDDFGMVRLIYELAELYVKSEKRTDVLAIIVDAHGILSEKEGVNLSSLQIATVPLARIYDDAGRQADAVRLHEKLIGKWQKDNHPAQSAPLESLNYVAWALATSPQDELRDGKRAIELATKACELTKFEEPNVLDTLAAAYAEAGDFESAVKWSKKALELVGESDDAETRQAMSNALRNYNEKKPTRQAAAPAVGTEAAEDRSTN
jgi:tetratricopeptide (TPR) repeat protein